MTDPYDLERFVSAQDAGGTYERAVDELLRGRKATHWMWFIFPQIAGLGRSSMSENFAIASLAEAKAYLAHPVLGPRLRHCAAIVAGSPANDATAMFGQIDAVKLRSSMTLFLRAAPDEPTWSAVLDRYFGGMTDAATDRQLGLA